MDLCRNMISEKNTPCIPIEDEEKDSITKYINKKYKSDFNELRYIKNIEKSEGFINFWFFVMILNKSQYNQKEKK